MALRVSPPSVKITRNLAPGDVRGAVEIHTERVVDRRESLWLARTDPFDESRKVLLANLVTRTSVSKSTSHVAA